MTNAAHSSSTRRRLLEAAFQEIYEKGFQSAGITEILAKTGMTRGALYHHFASKLQLGYAVVDEVIAENITAAWITPLVADDAGIESIKGSIAVMLEHAAEADLALGCPLNNLAQEMAPLDEGFRKRIADQFERWRTQIAIVLDRDQKRGVLRLDFDPQETAVFIVAAVEGGISLAKGTQDLGTLQTCFGALLRYLDSLKQVTRARRKR